MSNMTPEQAIAELWEMGDLSYKLKGIQLDMRNLVYESLHDISVYLCSRQTGKSFTMCLIAVEFCQRNPNTKVLLLFPKKKDASSVAKEQLRIIHEDCPPHLKPEHKIADKEFVYPNGSTILMGGTDGGSAEAHRGKTIHLILCDEAGFYPYHDFGYIINSVLMPMLTTTNGKMIMASTPSKEPDHPFLTDYVDPYRANGWLVEYTIHDNPLIDDRTREKIVNRYPLGEQDPEYQREYLLMTNTTSSLMVIPEWHDIQSDIVREEGDIPAYYDAYVSCDPAVVDLTGILYGYWDFQKQKLIIIDETILGGEGQRSLTTDDIAHAIKRKESINFRNNLTGEVYTPYMRIIDNNLPLLVNDLNAKHDLMFRTTKKDNKEDKVNQVRMMMKRGEIAIHPRCVNLIEHIRTARWTVNRKEFARNKGNPSKGIKGNHSDLLDALVYLVRNLQPQKNPFPSGYFDLHGEGIFGSRVNKKEDKNLKFMKKIMNINN